MFMQQLSTCVVDQTQEICYMPRIQKRFAALLTYLAALSELQQTENTQVVSEV